MTIQLPEETAHASILERYDGWVNRQLRLPQLSESEEARLRSSQAEVFCTVLPPVMISNMAAAVVTASAAVWYGWLWSALGWLTTVLAIGVLGLRRTQVLALKQRQRPPSARFTQRTIIDSTFMALPWLVAGLWLNPAVVPEMESLIATMLAGLVFAGIFTMASMPAAALAFSGLIMIGRMTQVLFTPPNECVASTALLTIYVVILIVCLRAFARLYVERIQAETAALELRETAQRRARREEDRRQRVEGHSHSFRDEAGEIIETVAQSLARATTVAGVLEEIAGATHASVLGAIEQVSSVNTDISRVQIHSRQLSDSARQIRRNARETARLVQAAAENVDLSLKCRTELSAAVSDISKVSDMIRTITAQTNLLALNATIEAARAGAAGRGFAVVAGEVKALAARTAQATLEISSRIEEVQHAADRSLNAMQDIGGSIDMIVEASRGIDETTDQQDVTVEQMTILLEQAVDQARAALSSMSVVGVDAQRTLVQSNAIAEAASVVDGEIKRLGQSVTRFSSRFAV
ncbi:MAG: hypothetical protein EOP23_12525 [Hyphomicrobiales bacterium]|nr:MAG: hypothetical protein EOP23_12525 [Hyphomicrobiales bacterium]